MSIVDQLYSEFKQLEEHLDSAKEYSLLLSSSLVARKALLLCAASSFEVTLCRDLYAFCDECAQSNSLVTSFVQRKAIERQYHTFFDWKEKKPGPFFAMLGDDFKSTMQQRLKTDPELKADLDAFLDLGSDRNRLVHQDFGSFTLEKTTDEVYQTAKRAERFVLRLPDLYRGKD